VAQLRFLPQPIPGLYIIEAFKHSDARGDYVKTFRADEAAEHGIVFAAREDVYSISRRNVLRGMHFQTPPQAHQKLVSCLTGRVLDVVVDLRKTSPTYRQFASVELSGENRRSFLVPAGLAHGFLSLEDDSRVVYKTDLEYAPDNDAAIHWDSFGFKWPVATSELIISDRDNVHPALSDYNSPF
jgi:dTDP-4-dehydrorhamnose 3,5-epimerase